MKKSIVSICFYMILLSVRAGAEAGGPKNFEIEVVAGLPQIMSIQVGFMGMRPFVFGVGLGTVPIDPLLQRFIPVQNVPLNLGLPDAYTLVPSSRFSLTSASVFVRYQPQGTGSGFLGEFNIGLWRFGATVAGALRNDTAGTSTSNVATGTLDLLQPVVSAMFGYRIAFTEALGLHLQAGAIYLLKTSYTTSTGGTLTSVLPLAGAAAQADFERAKGEVETQIHQGIDNTRAYTNWLPALSVTLAYAF
jgi:hypothetical protein